jgi:Kinesin motor domain
MEMDDRDHLHYGDDSHMDDVLEILDHSGLIPRILHDVIEGMRMQEQDMEESDMRITFSFLEIYNEKIRDLLLTDDEGTKSIPESSSSNNGTTSQSFALKVREHPQLGPYVEGLTKPTVSTAEEALRLLSVGLSRRSTTQTAWNAHSSRSHAVVTLEISHASKYADKAYSSRSIDARSHLFSPTVSFSRSTKNGAGMSPDCHGGDATAHSVTSLPVHPGTGRDPEHDSRHFVRVQLVDLAGSERDPMQPGKVPREGDELDLMASAAPPSNSSSRTPRRASLGAASRGNSEAFGGSSSTGATSNSSAVNTTEMRMIRRSLSTLGYIIKALGRGEAFKSLPYRDSVLTWLLRDALSGKNHTTMLATLSPAHTCHDESLNTLKYAERLCQVSSKGMQFKANDGSYGFPSSALSSSSKDIVQLRHQNSAPSSTGRDGYTYEYGALNSSIHDSLGGNRPGTLAARMLLRRTITDPQQRLAKIGVHKPKYSHGTLNGSGTEPDEHDRQLGFSLDGYDSLYQNQREPSSAFNVTSKTLDNLERLTKEIDRERLEDSAAATALELEGLKNAYRSLHGQHIEREIELEATRTDRDSLMVELKTAKEAVAQLENGEDGSEPWNRFPGSRSVAAASDMREAVEKGERELADLRAIVTRKEAAVDHLLSDLAAEKKARAALETGTQEQAVEFLSRLEKLQRENDSLLAQLSQSMMRSEEVPLAWASIKAERNLLKDISDQQQERTAEYLELLEEAATAEGNLKTELKAALADLKSSQERLLLLEGEAGMEISRLKVEVAAITRDRDALIAVIDQQEVALQLQNRQSAAAMKALEQRQAALERSEQEAVVAEDELSRLQKGLADFLTKEGDKMTGEMHDAKRFVRVIAEVRKRLLEADTVHDDLVHERALRLQLQHILDTVPKTNSASSVMPSKQRPTHTMATQTIGASGPSPVPIAPGPQPHSSSLRSSTTNSQSTVNVNINSHSQSQFPRAATPRSHAEVQMRLQTYSNPVGAISSEDSSILQHSSVVNMTQSKIEAQQMHLHTQQQQQFQQLMEQLDQQRRATEASEQRAQYWQHVAHTEQTKGSSFTDISNINTTTTNTNRSTSNTNISIIKGNIDDSSTDTVKVSPLLSFLLLTFSCTCRLNLLMKPFVLQAENRRLREELEHMATEALAASADLRNSKALMQKEVWSSKEELRVSREGMQGELASLWMAVQELNKLDAVKEKKMQELLCDRDAASEAKDAALRQLEEMTDNYNELQTELQVLHHLHRLMLEAFASSRRSLSIPSEPTTYFYFTLYRASRRLTPTYWKP